MTNDELWKPLRSTVNKIAWTPRRGCRLKIGTVADSTKCSGGVYPRLSKRAEPAIGGDKPRRYLWKKLNRQNFSNIQSAIFNITTVIAAPGLKSGQSNRKKNFGPALCLAYQAIFR
jgi:hypothetical protein